MLNATLALASHQKKAPKTIKTTAIDYVDSVFKSLDKILKEGEDTPEYKVLAISTNK